MPRKKTTAEFIIDSITKYRDRYDYSNVVYLGNKVKVDIVCKEHGLFKQTPNDHLGGHGCRKCSEEYQLNYNLKEAYSNKNKDFILDLYVLEINRNNDIFIKVGISKQINRRVINIETKSKGKVKILLKLETTLQEATLLEDKILLNLKNKYRKFYNKEFTGYTECLKIEAKYLILEQIKNFLCKENHRSDLVGKILDWEYEK